MGGGRYSTNNRVNAASAAAAAQRAAALASGPAYPVVNEPVVNLPTKSVVQPAPEEFASLASPFDAGFSNSNFGGYSGIDLDLSGLDIDALRETFNPTPAPTERVPTTASTSGLSVQDFGAQPKFGSPDEALANYGNVFNTLKGQEEQVNKVYNYNNFDPGDFGRTSVSLREGNRAAGTGLAEYVQQNDIPLYKVIDGERKYLTTGNPQANAELWPNGFQGGTLIATGPAGTYSTTFVKDANFVDEMLATPILRAAAAVATGGASETVIAAGKGWAGETLHASDWLSLAMAGANAYADVGVTQAAAEAAATSAVDAAYAAGTVQNAYEMQALYDATLAATKIQGVIGGVDVSGLLSATSNLDPTDLQDVVNSANSFSTVYTNIKEDNEQSDVDAAIALADRLEQERLERLEKDSTDALAATEVVVSNPVTGEPITPTGVTPDMPPTVTDVEPEFDVEPIVAEPIVVDISESGSGGGAGESGDTGGDAGAAQPPTETSDPAAEENNWEYLGDGVFKHVETGESVQETITGEDPYIVGDTYSGPSSGSAEDTTDPSEVIDIISDILEDTTAESPVSSDPIITYDPTTVTDPATGTADTGTATGDGTGTRTGTGDTAGTGDTTGTGAGGGDATGTGDGTGDDTGTGSGSGTGDGTGSGDGSGDGDGDGEGEGEGEGIGTGGGSPIAATSTTDSLFGDLLGIDQTITAQERLMPFKASEARRLQETEAAQANLLQRFIQPAQPTRPQGMLTRRF